jgi:hypothetical protein
VLSATENAWRSAHFEPASTHRFTIDIPADLRLDEIVGGTVLGPDAACEDDARL